MKKLEAPEVADLLLEIGRRASLEGGNPYKAKAYVRAAESLRNASRPLAEMIRCGELRQIPGVGDAIAERIANLHRTGTDPTLTKMRAKLPTGVLDLLAVPGLRPDKALRLHDQLGIGSLDDHEQACRKGRLEGVKGLGPALQRKISQSLEILRTGRGQLHMHRATELLDHGISELERHRPELKDIQIAGDLGRGCEVVADLRLVATSSKWRSTTEEQVGNIVLHVTRPEWFGAILAVATGSVAHVAKLRELASSKGLAITPEGVKRGEKAIPTPRESDVYKLLGLPFIEPELREGEDEIRLAKSKNYRASYRTATSEESFTAIRICRTACIPWSRWRNPRGRVAISTSGSPTTRNLPTMPAASQWRRSSSSTRKSMPLMPAMALALGF
jgi:DNA polymerase (family 10)